MKNFIKHIIIVLVAFSALGLGSCAHQHKVAKPKKEKIEFVSIDKVGGSIKEGVKITATITNNMGLKLRVIAAEAYLLHKGKKIGRIALNKEVELPRRATTQVVIPLKATLSGPLATISAINNLRKGDFSGLTVDVSATISTRLGSRTFEKKSISFEDFSSKINLKLKK